MISRFQSYLYEFCIQQFVNVYIVRRSSDQVLNFSPNLRNRSDCWNVDMVRSAGILEHTPNVQNGIDKHSLNQSLY